MKAVVLEGPDKELVYTDVKEPSPGENEVVVELKTAALNRRDFWITKGKYPGIRYPVILGSDGCGTLDGKRVLINPNQDWGSNPQVQSSDYRILGTPENGTFAQYIAVGKDKVEKAPEHLSDEQAAALPLAGMTAYRALITKCQPTLKDKVLVTGVGGGVALFAVQFALALGCEVYVTSGSDDKISKAMEVGAKSGSNYKDENWAKDLANQAGGFDVIIDSAGGDGFSNLINLANPGARIAMYGGTRGKIDGISPQKLFWKQISWFGSTMATDEEFKKMVRFVDENKIHPIVDKVFPLEKAQEAIDYNGKGLQFGKVVLQI
ncbi:MAG: zinc-binding dehydrogenase [Saprospiraceae bacterium]